ncbi:acetyltransferase [Paenibacillus mucilaginosus K02]|uniref:Acetyltransferase n=3 Tax=Paenibacillus mucilaginosus TaxID=61624 RepID=I0BV11_9BACL|nr:putative acetyltransferase [Paenibacillus mucilaginosus KNP414]AFH66208.1 acetyltransferase [Paenibacillus mucilaginosus K02]WDM31477.1 GNAT family N-acetyltransferase [Paenibacillus mucilaginosus]WFA22824.1 GNAT family N-acetyltransferase [Paenibacillus mucilaginosus]
MIHIPENKPPKEVLLADPGIRSCLDGWGRPGDSGWIARTADGQPAGTAWYRLYTAEKPGYGFVDERTPELSVAVLPGLEGQGIGTQLLSHLIAEAAAAGYPALSLSVDPSNAALRLYERLGFVRTGESGTSWTLLLKLQE